MAKEVAAVIVGKGVEGSSGGMLKPFQRSLRGLSQGSLELGEGHLNRIEIGAVGRKVMERSSATLHRLPDSGYLVAGEVVADDHVCRTQFGTEALLDIGREELLVHRPVDEERSRNPIMP